jgi:hypothetical protein
MEAKRHVKILARAAIAVQAFCEMVNFRQPVKLSSGIMHQISHSTHLLSACACPQR